MWWKDELSRSNHALVTHSNGCSESPTSSHQLFTFASTSSESSETLAPVYKDTSFMQGSGERRSSSPTMVGRRASLAAALNNSILRRRGSRRRSSVRHKESSFMSVWRRCLPCTLASGYRYVRKGSGAALRTSHFHLTFGLV